MKTCLSELRTTILENDPYDALKEGQGGTFVFCRET